MRQLSSCFTLYVFVFCLLLSGFILVDTICFPSQTFLQRVLEGVAHGAEENPPPPTHDTPSHPNSEALSGSISSLKDQVVNDIKESMQKGFHEMEEMKRKFEQLSRPAVNILKGVADQDFLRLSYELISQSNWSLFWWSQLIALGFVILLRLWFLRRPLPWYRRLWVDTWTFIFYLFLLFFGVPLVTIGEPYRKMIKSIWTIYASSIH